MRARKTRVRAQLNSGLVTRESSSLYFNTDTIASDFEEHLGQGLGVRCPLCVEIWIVAVVYCEEEDLKWKSGITCSTIN